MKQIARFEGARASTGLRAKLGMVFWPSALLAALAGQAHAGGICVTAGVIGASN